MKKKYILLIVIIVGLICLGLILFMCKDKKDEPDTKKEISNEEIIKKGEELFDYAEMENLHMIYKYVSDEAVDLTDELSGYEISNYEEVRKHFTKECKTIPYLEEGNNNVQKCMDTENVDSTLRKFNDKYYEVNLGRGGNISYINRENLKIKDITDEKVVFEAIYNYCADDAIYDEESDQCENNGKRYSKKYDFIIEKEDNEWKIAYFVMPY